MIEGVIEIDLYGKIIINGGHNRLVGTKKSKVQKCRSSSSLPVLASEGVTILKRTWVLSDVQWTRCNGLNAQVTLMRKKIQLLLMQQADVHQIESLINMWARWASIVLTCLYCNVMPKFHAWRLHWSVSRPIGPPSQGSGSHGAEQRQKQPVILAKADRLKGAHIYIEVAHENEPRLVVPSCHGDNHVT